MKFLEIAKGKFARKDDPLDAQSARKGGAFRGSNGHLRRGMDRQVRRDLRGEPHQSDVLHDESVDARAIQQPQVLGGIRFGRGAKLGALSVVLRDVPPGATAVGIPARIVEPGEVAR